MTDLAVMVAVGGGFPGVLFEVFLTQGQVFLMQGVGMQVFLMQGHGAALGFLLHVCSVQHRTDFAVACGVSIR